MMTVKPCHDKTYKRQPDPSSNGISIALKKNHSFYSKNENKWPKGLTQGRKWQQKNKKARRKI